MPVVGDGEQKAAKRRRPWVLPVLMFPLLLLLVPLLRPVELPIGPHWLVVLVVDQGPGRPEPFMGMELGGSNATFSLRVQNRIHVWEEPSTVRTGAFWLGRWCYLVIWAKGKHSVVV